jgi:hypothetical protein
MSNTSYKEFVRESDGKVFRWDELSGEAHPSVVSQDGETDTIKWVGSDFYVSMSQGHSYTLKS